MPSIKRTVAVRLDDKTAAALERIAVAEMRSLANVAEIFIRDGLKARIEKNRSKAK